MKILALAVGDLQANCYIVEGDRKQSIVIDPGDEYPKIKELLQKNGLSCVSVLLTHGHFDHMNAAAAFQRDGATVYVHRADADKLNTFRSLSVCCSQPLNKLTADVLLDGGETLEIAGLEIIVLHTPGHSAGGVCYKIGNALFTGDTLMKSYYGRTDFYDGDYDALKNSITKILFGLVGEYDVYPGHYEQTTLSRERRMNTILFD